MGKSQKRKRDSSAADDNSDLPAAKIQILDDGVTKSKKVKAAEKRQQKSERRKKEKAARAKDGAAKNKQKLADLNKVAVGDNLATGDDFVPLGGASFNAKFKKGKGRSPRSIRKERIEKQKLAQAEAEADALNAAEGVDGGDTTAQKSESTKAGGSEARFICFVGNLPYTATVEQIQAHFAKLQPQSIRLSTDKKTRKSKGFAFLEFDNYDRMKTCLKLYHHSTFDPDTITSSGEGQPTSTQDGKSNARKINVELTAGGGGGKSEGRKVKIKAKNRKLDEERFRDQEKKKQKQREGESKKSKKGPKASGANADEGPVDTRGDIHPSRLSRVTM